MYFCLSKPFECFTISSEGRKQTSEGSVSSYSLVEANIMGQEECMKLQSNGYGSTFHDSLENLFPSMDIECAVPNVNDIEAKVFYHHSINMFFLDYFAYLEPIFPKYFVKLEATNRFYRLFMKEKFLVYCEI